MHGNYSLVAYNDPGPIWPLNVPAAEPDTKLKALAVEAFNDLWQSTANGGLFRTQCRRNIRRLEKVLPSTSSPDDAFNLLRDRYIGILEPLFLPDDVVSNDIIRYFASLLRVLGMEDKGWDPYAESRFILEDLNGLMKTRLQKRRFPDPDKTRWRLGLLLYSHIVEMDAPFEVITNLLRFRVGRGYSPSPFFDLLTEKEKKNFARNGVRTARKIDLIKQLSTQAGIGAVGALYDEFYDGKLRNAIQHSDFILADKEFRSLSGTRGTKIYRLSYDELNAKIFNAKAFIAAVFQIETTARQVWGLRKGTAIPYDPIYKGLMEVLVDDDGLMCGFTVHWPNNSESTYRRTENGIEMSNCNVDLAHATLSLFVDRYARAPGDFSPLVERDAHPVYTPLDDTEVRPVWPNVISKSVG